MKNRLLDSMPAIACATFFSLSVNTAPFAYQSGIIIFVLLSLRFMITCLMANGVVAAQNQKLRLSSLGKKQIYLVLFTSVCILSQSYSYLAAIELAPVSIAVTGFFTFPLLTYLLNQVIKRQAPSPLTVALLIVAISGIYILSQNDDQSWPIEGLFWALAGGFFQALINISSSYVTGVKGWQMVRLTTLLPAIVFTVVAINAVEADIGLLSALEFLQSPGFFWGSLSALTFGFGYLFLFTSIGRIGASRTSNLLYTEPVITILLALLIHQEILSQTQVYGMIMILASALIIEFWEQRSKNV